MRCNVLFPVHKETSRERQCPHCYNSQGGIWGNVVSSAPWVDPAKWSAIGSMCPEMGQISYIFDYHVFTNYLLPRVPP